MIKDRLHGLHIKRHKLSLKVRLIPDDEALEEFREFGKNFAVALNRKL